MADEFFTGVSTASQFWHIPKKVDEAKVGGVNEQGLLVSLFGGDAQFLEVVLHEIQAGLCDPVQDGLDQGLVASGGNGKENRLALPVSGGFPKKDLEAF